MNYKEVYNSLIESRRNRILDENEYYERHHIIPKCIGGDDCKENIVMLTGREHFLAHAILALAYPKHKGLANAIMAMKQKWPARKMVDYTINSRIYERLKKQWIELHSGENHHLYGKTHSPEAKRKISEARKGTFPAKDVDGKIIMVHVDDPRVLSGELKHHTFQRIKSEKECADIKARTQGYDNPNARSITDEEMVNRAISFYLENDKIWDNEKWYQICKEENIPAFTFGRMRFGGKGKEEFIKRIEAIVGPITYYEKRKDPKWREEFRKNMKKKNFGWFYNEELKKNAQFNKDNPPEGWKRGRKLEWH